MPLGKAEDRLQKLSGVPTEAAQCSDVQKTCYREVSTTWLGRYYTVSVQLVFSYIHFFNCSAISVNDVRCWLAVSSNEAGIITLHSVYVWPPGCPASPLIVPFQPGRCFEPRGRPVRDAAAKSIAPLSAPRSETWWANVAAAASGSNGELRWPCYRRKEQCVVL